jgi:pyrroloquinoline quinone biosynthesis protein B
MARLTARLLGTAAGGGYPQWNCRCAVCRLAWEGDPRVEARTQAGVAVSGDGESWILLNASPDLRAQIAATAALHPRTGVRHSPIAAVVLTGAEVDQTAGLLHLRERHRFALYGTTETIDILTANPIFAALGEDIVPRRKLAVGKGHILPGGVELELFAVPGKVPLYLEDQAGEGGLAEPVAGIEVRRDGTRLVFVPGCAAPDDDLMQRLAAADVVLFDGTLFADDEMIRAGVGEKTGRRMGHMQIAGPDGSLAALSGLRKRRIYIHINNTNPLLIAGSPERAIVEAAGWEVAADGMEIVL